jgi:membrane protein implicated in regulation of membrane protease activity/flagellar biosynthesis protein FliQ
MKMNAFNHVGFVKLHRPGRLSVVTACILCVTLVASYFLAAYQVLSLYFIPAIFLMPFVIFIFDSYYRKRLLPRGKPTSELASQVKKLKLRWLLKRNGRGVKGWNRVGLGLPRTLADSSLQEQLGTVVIPEGLVEPEQIATSKPGSLLGCIVGVALSSFIIWGMILAAGTLWSSKTIGWIVILVLLWNILQLILGLPAVHRSRKLPAFLRAIGRRRMLSRPIVAGPGWVKLGGRVWRADRDMLLIRRTGFRLATSEIDCMFAGPEKRRRMTFSGIADEDFQLLYGFWNVNDVRLEFIDSDLS